MNSPKMEFSPWLVFSLGFLAQALVILGDTNAQDGMFQFFPPLCPCYFCAHLLILLLFCAASGLNGIQDSWNKKPSNWRVGTDPCGDKWNGISCTTSRVTAMLVSAATRYYHIRSFPSSHPFYRWAIHHSFCFVVVVSWWLLLQKTLEFRIVRIPFRRHPVTVRIADLVWNISTLQSHFIWFYLFWVSRQAHELEFLAFVSSMWGDCLLFFFFFGRDFSYNKDLGGPLPASIGSLSNLENLCATKLFKEFQLSTDFNIFTAWIVPWLICSPTPPQNSCRLQLFWRNTERTRTAHQA